MKHDYFIRARHVPGMSNEMADALSLFQVSRFRAAATTAKRTPYIIPPLLMTL